MLAIQNPQCTVGIAQDSFDIENFHRITYAVRMKWTEAQEEFVLSHAKTMPSSAIVDAFFKKFGVKRTENAIKSLAHRYGVRTYAQERVAKIAPAKRYVESPCFEGVGVPLSKHQEGQCRWPFNGGTFCGQEVETNGYCDYHHYISIKGYEPTQRAIHEGTVVFRNRRGHGVVAQPSGRTG